MAECCFVPLLGLLDPICNMAWLRVKGGDVGLLCLDSLAVSSADSVYILITQGYGSPGGHAGTLDGFPDFQWLAWSAMIYRPAGDGRGLFPRLLRAVVYIFLHY